jgi:hypothetical protein
VISNVVVSYNVMVDLYSNLSCFHLGDSFGVSVSGIRFENNTVVPNPTSGDYLIWFDVNPTPSVASYRNNLIVLNPGMQIVSYGNTNFTHDHNLFWRTDGSTGSLGMTLGTSEILANPGFVNLAGLDVHLQTGSPARGAGTALGYSSDFDANPVPVSSPSIGAYE